MSMIGVDYGVLNQRGSPSWFSDIYANIPTAGYKGRMFISTDTFAFYRDTGTGWDLIGGPGTGTITGSGASGQVSYFNGSSTLAGSNNLFWDITNSRLGIGTTTPGVALDIHATGTNAQFNGTGTNNAYLVFQNSGTSKWRIGNTYNAGANSFDIYNNGLTTNAISISSTTNNITLTGGLTTSTLNVTNTTTLDNNILIKKVGLSITTSTYITQFAASSGVGIGYSDGTGGANFIFPTASIYDYTFPATTGTLALTSNLSSYVPYSGATGSVNLGNYDLTVYGITIGRGGGSVATNTALGYQALNNGSGTQNDQNTAIGYRSLYSNTLGQYNTALGYFSLYNNLIGASNTGIGYYSLYTNTGSDNTGTGYRALYLNSSGANNTAFGRGALDQNSTGSNNTAIGMAAGYGTGTNYNTTGSNNIFIGYQSVGVSSTASNRTFIGNSSTTSTWLGGNLLIGTTTDSGYNLEVTGTGRISQLYINPTNTATTGLDVASDNISFRSDNLEGFKRQLLITMGSGTLIQFTAQGYGANYGTDLAFYTATTSGVNSSPAIYITGTNNRVGIKTGTPSYDLDVSGTARISTSAYFATSSGSVGIGTTSASYTLDINAASGYAARLNGATYGGLILSAAGTNNTYIVGDASTLSVEHTSVINLRTTNVNRLSISSTGIATFTSSSTNIDTITIKNASGKTNVTIGSAGGTALYGGLNMFDNSSVSTVYFITDSTANSYVYSGFSIGASLSSYKLQISTDSAGKPNGGSWANSSDVRLKENIKTIDNALNKIIKLRGVTFDWKDESEQDNIKSSGGFIADEVMIQFPNWVKEVKASKNQKQLLNDDKIKSLSLPFEFDALIVEAIKELNEKLVRNNIN